MIYGNKEGIRDSVLAQLETLYDLDLTGEIFAPAELLDVPEKRPDGFRPNPESELRCFDETHYLFRTLNEIDKLPTQNFLEEVDKRRLRILERYAMGMKLFAK